jgi:hypothetical protein
MAGDTPTELLGLPNQLDGDPWPYNVWQAHCVLLLGHAVALKALWREDSDAFHLRHHCERIFGNFMPILEALAELGLPMVARDSDACLRSAGSPAWNSRHRCWAGVRKIFLLYPMDPLTYLSFSDIIPSPCIFHCRHHVCPFDLRPRKVLQTEWMKEVMSTQHSVNLSKWSKLLGIHRNTLWYNLKAAGMVQCFSDLSDTKLDVILKIFKTDRSESGLWYVMGWLTTRGFRIPKERIRFSWWSRIDVLGHALWHNATIRHCKYTCQRPNFVWHGDGHHKLIKYGIVIHGFMDGYDHTVRPGKVLQLCLLKTIQVMGIAASADNHASTVFNLFMTAIGNYGIPSCLWGDHGGEIVQVVVWMVMHQGPNRGSFMWGLYRTLPPLLTQCHPLMWV